MNGYITSYSGIFKPRSGNTITVKKIAIPIIQRDYAQGRSDERTGRIRTNFLDALYQAITTDEPIGLDFIYGDVDEKGTLSPLDGQQRLTTLFLLHWYLAWRADRLDQEKGWKSFTYETRYSAKQFCQLIVSSKPDLNQPLSVWFKDQYWFLYTWQHDPTIRSMLQMLEAIHEKFDGIDHVAAWERLIDPVKPAISFHLLPIEQMGLSQDLYIKMNSRGKPLTDFENFKAIFEQILETSSPDHVNEFARKIDGVWADLLWKFRGADNLVDDQFLHYLKCITEISYLTDTELNINRGDFKKLFPDDKNPNIFNLLLPLVKSVYSSSNKRAREHFQFLAQSLDTWLETDTNTFFSSIFTQTATPLEAADARKIALFGTPGTPVDIFVECCRQSQRNWQRLFLLHAVLLHRLNNTENFMRRARMLRNLINASNNEIRIEKIPELLEDVRRIVVDGDISSVTTFNRAQVEDEEHKIQFLAQTPELEHILFDLEDHNLLRGCLSAFDLDQSTFEHRARIFHKLFADSDLLPLLTGALLAAGDYSRSTHKGRFANFGSSAHKNITTVWRDLLTGVNRANLKNIRQALGHVLDDVARLEGQVDLKSALEGFKDNWLNSVDPASGLSWRWYFVKYDEMRAGRSGIYASSNKTLGYDVCMLDQTVMSSYYRDPYLSAIQSQSQIKDLKREHEEVIIQGEVVPNGSDGFDGPWFSGYETDPRWMLLVKSGVKMRCVHEGLLLSAPTDEAHLEKFESVCTAHGLISDTSADQNVRPHRRLVISQVEVDGQLLDTADRVKLGAHLLSDLVRAGL